jgi:hypothetical protein
VARAWQGGIAKAGHGKNCEGDYLEAGSEQALKASLEGQRVNIFQFMG